MDIEKYWRYVLDQNREAMRAYFAEGAYVNWHNTDEHFTVDEFIRANCEYPGEWDGKLERTERQPGLLITVAHVWSKEEPLSFHVVSFFRIADGRITALDEYWGDDGPAPAWRLDKKIGRKI